MDSPDTQPLDYVRRLATPADLPSTRAVWHISHESPLGHLITFACAPDSYYPGSGIMTTRARPPRVCAKCLKAKGV